MRSCPVAPGQMVSMDARGLLWFSGCGSFGFWRLFGFRNSFKFKYLAKVCSMGVQAICPELFGPTPTPHFS